MVTQITSRSQNLGEKRRIHIDQYYEAGGAGTQIVSNQPMGLAPIERYAVSKPNRAMRKLADRAEVYSQKERHKVRLAAEIMYNTIGLSAIADNASQFVPSSEPLCREIAKRYAFESIDELGRSWR